MLDVGQQGGQVGGVVGEVGVDLHADVGAAVDGPAEPLAVGRSEPAPPGAHEDVDAAVLGGQLLGQLGRAVGAVVVDDEDVDRRARPRAAAGPAPPGSPPRRRWGRWPRRARPGRLRPRSTARGDGTPGGAARSLGAVEPPAELPLSALPSPLARAAAFAAICLAGLAGGADRLQPRRAAVRRRLRRSRSASGSSLGAVVAAGGMSIVAVLVLRALGEWRELQDRRRRERSSSTTCVDELLALACRLAVEAGDAALAGRRRTRGRRRRRSRR